MKTAAVLLCAGKGSRMRGSVNDKVLAPLSGACVLAHGVRAFKGVADIFVCVVRDAAQRARIADVLATEGVAPSAVRFADGGAERQDSVAHGLAALDDGVGVVFIHDAARPLIRPDALRALREAAVRDGGAVLAHRVIDTVKKIEGASLERQRLHDLDRKTLWAMETPQVFRMPDIRRAYDAVRAAGARVTDDTAAFAAAGGTVTIVENFYPNPKITRPEDLDFVEWLLARGH